MPLPDGRLAAIVTAPLTCPSQVHPADEVPHMASGVMRLVAAATVALGAVIVITSSAHAETCVNAMPFAARDVRGYTFEGEILSITLEPENEPGMPRSSNVRIAVWKVHANPTDRPSEEPVREGQTIEIHSNACDGIVNVGVEVGSEVLISTRSRYSASTWDTAVWEKDGSTLRLLVLLDSRSAEVWLTNDRRLADARTMREALALVAPTAVGMPDTATEPNQPSGAGLALSMVVGIVGFTVALLGTKPRRMVRGTRP